MRAETPDGRRRERNNATRYGQRLAHHTRQRDATKPDTRCSYCRFRIQCRLATPKKLTFCVGTHLQYLVTCENKEMEKKKCASRFCEYLNNQQEPDALSGLEITALVRRCALKKVWWQASSRSLGATKNVTWRDFQLPTFRAFALQNSDACRLTRMQDRSSQRFVYSRLGQQCTHRVSPDLVDLVALCA